ncbi:hypothetical protein H072_1607 [Dactylellina haptotyla CBS 200.50]|uniref:Non-homologous end-joining factor 1 n=1 Tax=Dactylellina haptotyla (strain CBS 200.50) TaxID=1284197 RepID=S8C9U4_DACHA|nr:hypothetical protein H072_1607 [Dactylellina haptotyla CBS 200.50]
MAPTPIAPWELFPLQNPSSPPLYLQRRFTETSYAVYLTDLTSIWAESLEKGSICDRAEDRNCSIDPSTDESQLQILLEKLSSGITGINPAVTVELEVRGDTFNVNTKEKLQAPLQPLEWRFRLKLQPGAQFTKNFSLPLLYYGSLLSRQTASLLSIIDEKDVAIARLLEKFEEYKIDISSVFPGYKKGRPPTGRAKGIKQFDQDDWKRDILATELNTKTSKELVKATFKHIPKSNYKLEIPLPKPSETQWWTKINGKVIVKGEPEVEATPHTTPRKPPKPVRLNTDSDDDFEALRSSPVRTRVAESSVPVKSEAPLSKPAADGDTTEDEDDLDVAPKSQSSRATTNKSSQPTPPPVGRTASPRRSMTLSVSPKPPKRKSSAENRQFEENFGNSYGLVQALVDDEATTSESDDEPAPNPTPKTAPKAGGIKKTIGGKKKQEPAKPAKADSEEDMPAPPPEPEAEPEPPKRTGKIKGTIGGRKIGGDAPKRKEPEPDSDEEMVDPEQEAPKPPPKKKEKTKSPPIEGMDEDAAQKRREELQKQLAAKSAGKKKGRKF